MTNPVTTVSATLPRDQALPTAPAPKNMAPAQGAATPVAAGLQTAAKSTPAEKHAALEEINKTLKIASIGVRFEFDQEAHKMVTKVVDVESGEMIRQMPSEEVVRIARAMNSLTGLLFSKTA